MKFFNFGFMTSWKLHRKRIETPHWAMSHILCVINQRKIDSILTTGPLQRERIFEKQAENIHRTETATKEDVLVFEHSWTRSCDINSRHHQYNCICHLIGLRVVVWIIFVQLHSIWMKLYLYSSIFGSIHKACQHFFDWTTFFIAC